MRVFVLYFQAAQRAAGTPREEIDLPAGSRVSDAIAAILAAHPTLAPLEPSLLIAVNEVHASRGAPLREGDTLALMPPFSGG